MKKCGIFVLGRNALGAQIHVWIISFDSFDVMCRRSVPTLRCPLAMSSRSSLDSRPALVGVNSGVTLSIWWQFTQPIVRNSIRPSNTTGAVSLIS